VLVRQLSLALDGSIHVFCRDRPDMTEICGKFPVRFSVVLLDHLSTVNLRSKTARLLICNQSAFLSDAEERVHTAVRIVYGSSVVRVD
jgi:hypothetical protein